MSGTAAQERLQLLASITTWERQIVVAKRRLNELTAVGRLPMEILLEIFMYRSADWSRGDLTWIGVAHVCHRWRDAAVHFRPLWAQVYTYSEAWTRRMLARSRKAALDIVVPECASHITDPAALVFCHINRARSVQCTITRGRLYLTVSTTRSAPLLRSLSLESNDRLSFVPYTPFDNVATPALTHLRLVNVPVDWSCSLFKPTLTHVTFRLRLLQLPHHRHWSVEKVLDVLRNMPLLQSLELINAISSCHDGAEPKLVPMSLHHLRHLELCTSAFTALQFLEYVAFPPDATISITLVDRDPEVENAREILRLLASKLISTPHSGEPSLLSGLHTRSTKDVWSSSTSKPVPVPKMHVMIGSPECHRTSAEANAILLSISEEQTAPALLPLDCTHEGHIASVCTPEGAVRCCVGTPHEYCTWSASPPRTP